MGENSSHYLMNLSYLSILVKVGFDFSLFFR
jgi:hypothetical protein